MGSDIPQLRVFFFPFLAYGHMIPIVDMAKLFATRGVKSTIITTPANVPHILKAIERSKDLGIEIDIKTIRFPNLEAGLPEGCEIINAASTGENASLEKTMKFFKAMTLFREPVEVLLGECKPDCLVADMFFPWATEVAAKFGIPRLVFHGTSFFYLCASVCMMQYEPYKKVLSDSEQFLVPNLPGDIKMTKQHLPAFVTGDVETDFSRLLKQVKESEVKSFGVVVNSFYELEPDYADHYRQVLGRRAWHIGPLSLCNRNVEDKALRGKQASIDEHECLKWLNSKKPNSVVYVCFGSMANFTSAQLMEIAMGLEASGQNFIWVVRKEKRGEEGGKEEWLPEGFERRVEGKGLIIRGWAPQVLILDHEAVGGFVTHCGWNSSLEGITSGVPMVTWPVAAEQFYNEKLLSQVLKIGVCVGVQKWSRLEAAGDLVKREVVEKVVKEVMMGDDKAEARRRRVKELEGTARRALEEGGSSFSDLNALIKELSWCRH